MDKIEALNILGQHLGQLRSRGYIALQSLLGEPETIQVAGPSGTEYQLEFEAFWDHRPHANLRVVGSIDDGGWRAVFPLTRDFIIVPDGTFVDE